MPEPLTWDNAQEIGVELSQKYPDLTPLSVSFADLQRYATALPGFKDDQGKLTQAKLEAIRNAWHEEFQDRTQD
ncbi:MAG TPA: Fe-S cluster assembly protein IscX [Terriglobales bacterium]|jgi:FeS assembly protein IscX|nr:Fe-S cluster assembly protein IscX [Terriglobales bacterium]